MQTGVIFDCKEFAVFDGPGMRQTYFLKGCPLQLVPQSGRTVQAAADDGEQGLMYGLRALQAGVHP